VQSRLQNPTKVWLAIGMPSVTRRQGLETGPVVDYLSRTIDTLAEDLPGSVSDPFVGQLEVWVMNNQPQGHPKGPHEIFQRNRVRFETHPKRHFFHFVDNPGQLQDPRPDLPDPDDENNPENRPGRYVRQQTCDVITLIRMVAPRSKYFMFMEDDFETCHNAIQAIFYATDKANAYSPNWLALRVSYGMNGIVMKSEDALLFADYLWQNVARLPPDLLYGEYRERLAGRPLMAYRFNQFNHIGTVSSLPRPNRPAFPQCAEELANVWSLSGEESFDLSQCAGDDISPCLNRGGVQSLVDWRGVCDGASSGGAQAGSWMSSMFRL